jgi:LemA protein
MAARRRLPQQGELTMWIVLLILVVLIVAFIGMYNGLVKLRVRVDNSRYDLIPNLVETVKGYASHEKDTLEAVIEARNRAMAVQGPEAKAQAENVLTGALRQLFALAEAYPQLRAVESFTELQGSLSEIEDAVQNARRYYNAVVRDYNTKIHTVPSNLVAGMFGFQPRQFFGLEDEREREAPKVDFGTAG